MARKSTKLSKADLQKLKKANQKLAAENAALKAKADKARAEKRANNWFNRLWRKVAVVILIVLAGALLVAGNLLFWAGHTVVDSQSYKQTVAPLIKDPEIQQAVSLYTTRQIFSNYDVTGSIQQVLPPRADFLAPTLTTQLQGFTQKAISQTLANQKFQDLWVNVNVKAHDSLLALANSPQGRDGVININEIYQQLSQNLADTKLSFLAGKKLPDSVGQITVLKSDKLRTLHIISSKITPFKYATLGLVALFSVGAVFLARNRRRMVIILGAAYATLMALTLVALRLMASVISGKVNADYQTAVSNAAGILFHPLRIQTWTVLAVSLLVVVIAWLSGPYRAAATLRARSSDLLSGRLHQTIFGQKENGFTLWIGQYKRVLQWLAVVLVVLMMLFNKLTPGSVIGYGLLMLVLVAAIEVLAAEKRPMRSRR